MIEINENVFLSSVELVELIGGGAFGKVNTISSKELLLKVYKALWAGTTIIAAKKLHSEENIPGFESEAAILRYFYLESVVYE